MNDTIQFTCPECSNRIQLPSSTVGKQGKCPACGHVVSIRPDPNDDDDFLAMAMGTEAHASGDDILLLDDPLLASDSTQIPITSLGSPEMESIEHARLIDTGRLRRLIELQEEANTYLKKIYGYLAVIFVFIGINYISWLLTQPF